MHLFVIPHWVTDGMTFALALLALWKGGTLERIVACTLALLTGASLVLRYLARAGLVTATGLDVFVLPIGDATMLVVCLACVTRATRYWTIWAASFALLGLIGDLAIFATPRVTRWAWISASLAWTYAIAGAVLWGVLTHQPQATATDKTRA